MTQYIIVIIIVAASLGLFIWSFLKTRKPSDEESCGSPCDTCGTICDLKDVASRAKKQNKEHQ